MKASTATVRARLASAVNQAISKLKPRVPGTRSYRVEPLERRMMLTVFPNIYGSASIPDQSNPTYALTLNPTGAEPGTITQWQINWGDYVNGSPDVQTISPAPTSYPATVTHTYAAVPAITRSPLRPSRTGRPISPDWVLIGRLG